MEQSELNQLNEDLTQVASVLSHDFRGPARHISGCTERVLEQIGQMQSDLSEGRTLDFTALENWARLAQQSADRLGRMIEDVLHFSRASTTDPKSEDIDVADVVADVLRHYADRILERNVTIKVTSLPAVRYDLTMLYLLLANLVSNAIKFSKKEEPNPVVEIDGRKTSGGNLVSITVRDHGIGIPLGQQQRVLDMGFRLHHESEYPGFGYGLAIVRKILKRCGGELGIRSKPGEGSEFVVTLPAGRLVP